MDNWAIEIVHINAIHKINVAYLFFVKIDTTIIAKKQGNILHFNKFPGLDSSTELELELELESEEIEL